jgi:hypothetical protein
MLKGCLVVPFIAPRQLGAVESISRRQFLPSVAWRTGQPGAPPDTVRCRFLSFFGEADRWRFGAVGAPDSPVPLLTVGSCHASHADYATDCWLTGQSSAPPDSPMNYSRTPLIASRKQPVDRCRLGAPNTVRCTTGHCLMHPDQAVFG